MEAIVVAIAKSFELLAAKPMTQMNSRTRLRLCIRMLTLPRSEERQFTR